MKKSALSCALLGALMYAGVTSANEFNYSNITSAKPANWWLNLSAGRGFNHSKSDKTQGVSSILSFNGAFSEKIYGTVYRFSTSGSKDDAMESGLMVGYRWSNPKGFYGLSSGIGYGSHYLEYQRHIGYTGVYTRKTEGVAVPVQFQAFWTPFKHFGFGITSHASLGQENRVSLQVGIQTFV